MTTTASTLPKLKDRLNPAQQAKRQTRIQARRTVAMELGQQQAITRGMTNYVLQVLGQGFWGRLKWLLFGIRPANHPYYPIS